MQQWQNPNPTNHYSNSAPSMHPSAPPYDDSHDYAPPSPFPYFTASPSPSRSHKHNPNPPYSTAYGYPYPYGHHLGPGSSLPPIYIDSLEVNINLGEPSAAVRYGSGYDGYGEGGSELGSDLHGTGDGGSRDGVYFADPGSKKLVLKLDICDDKAKRKVIQTVSKLAGIDAISVDMNEKKLTVIGDVDLVTLVKKLRKLCHTETISVGPVKEPEKKKDEPKKDEGNKDEEPKKDGGKKGEEPKKDGGRKDEQEEEMKGMAELVRTYKAYSPQMSQYYYVPSAEEDPKGCVIC